MKKKDRVSNEIKRIDRLMRKEKPRRGLYFSDGKRTQYVMDCKSRIVDSIGLEP